MDINNNDDELREIAPEVHRMQRDDGFRTPEHYFDSLADRVLVRIAEESGSTSYMAKRRNLPVLRYAMMAASVLVLIVAGIWLMRTPPVQDPLAEITPDEAFEYVMNNMDEYSSEDFIATAALGEWNGGEISPVSDDDVDQMLQMLDDDDLDQLFIN